MQTPTNRPADPSPLAILETALGGRSLRSLAEAATKSASAGYRPGRAGSSYGSAYEAAVDGVLEKLEDDRETADREYHAALSVVQRSDVSRLLGVDNGEAQRRADLARHRYDEIDARIATITALGRPLARRQHLVDLLAICEGDMLALDAEFRSLGPSVKWARREPSADATPIPGEPQRKRAVLDRERDLKARLDAVARDAHDARFALRRWDDEFREIASAIERAASR